MEQSSSIFVLGSVMNTTDHAVVGLVLRRTDICAQRAAILICRGLQLRYGNGDMVQATEHLGLLRFTHL